jgi:hypothetical protein
MSQEWPVVWDILFREGLLDLAEALELTAPDEEPEEEEDEEGILSDVEHEL